MKREWFSFRDHRGFIWRVFFAAPEHTKLYPKHYHATDYGVTYWRGRSIYINPHKPPDTWLTTLWHEIGHVYVRGYRIRNEEDAVESVARRLPAFLLQFGFALPPIPQ